MCFEVFFYFYIGFCNIRVDIVDEVIEFYCMLEMDDEF